MSLAHRKGVPSRGIFDGNNSNECLQRRCEQDLKKSAAVTCHIILNITVCINYFGSVQILGRMENHYFNTFIYKTNNKEA